MGIVLPNRNILCADDTTLIAKGRDFTTATKEAHKNMFLRVTGKK